MCDGLPGVVFLVVSLPTNFVKIRPYFTITNLVVKILTNCHNLFRNPLHWPICVFRKWIPHRVKVWRGCENNIVFFLLSQVPIRGCLVFVTWTLLSGRVLCSTDWVFSDEPTKIQYTQYHSGGQWHPHLVSYRLCQKETGNTMSRYDYGSRYFPNDVSTPVLTPVLEKSIKKDRVVQ
jgi:hypothetical protein